MSSANDSHLVKSPTIITHDVYLDPGSPGILGFLGPRHRVVTVQSKSINPEWIEEIDRYSEALFLVSDNKFILTSERKTTSLIGMGKKKVTVFDCIREYTEIQQVRACIEFPEPGKPEESDPHSGVQDKERSSAWRRALKRWLPATHDYLGYEEGIE